MPNLPVTVAFDAGPLHGAKTGVGLAVDQLRTALLARDDVALLDYVLSFRAELPPGTRRLPIPATLAHRLWARTPHPRVDRWLAGTDVVHGTNYVTPPSSRPAVVTVHDCWFLRRPADARAAVRHAGEVLRASIRRDVIVHTPSRATELEVRALFPDAAVRTVHWGPIPLPPPSPRPPVPELDGTPFILSIGTLERRKNLPRLVAAFGSVAAAHPEVRLVLGGDAGDDIDAVRGAIDALGAQLARRVLLTGRVDNGVRSWLLRHADVLAYPSLDEGFGFPLLDAMQAGTPVVASTAGSIPEVAGHAALLCDPLDVDALAAALATALTDDTARQQLIDAGRARWEEFDWHGCAQGMVDLYGLAVRGETDGLR